MGLLGNTIYFGTDQVTDFYMIDRTAYTFTSSYDCSPASPTSGIYVNRDYAIVNQAGCADFFQRTHGLQETGGEFATNFLPTANGVDPQQ